MDGKSNAGRKICAPLLLLTNDGAYAIITLYEGKEVAYALNQSEWKRGHQK